MRMSYLGAALVTAALLAGRASAAPAITGDYVESRSANVYVGACHHEGELMTAGRNALLAWNVTDGEYNGVSLKGVTAVAVVAGDKYLDQDGVSRQSVLYISDSASTEQRDAVVAMLKERAAKALGEVVGVKTGAVSFADADNLYRVQVPGVAFMKIRKATGELCCKQPYSVWGQPFVPVKDAKAGYCLGVEYKDSSLLKSWSATDQNNAFFGQFSL